MDKVSATEVAKYAAIVAASITVVFNVLLYVAKEWVERRRRRASAARQLVLVGYSLWESLRSDVDAFIFDDWYKLVALSEVVADQREVLALVAEVSRLHSVFREPSANLRAGRNHRENELETLKTRTVSLCRVFSVNHPWDA
jgi:hypothetical protein